MFSGLTNQVSSWMGAAKGEPQDEEVPTPTKEPTGEAAAAVAEVEKLSPTKAGSKLDLITNVKSQMTGWLGSGIPIPGLRKNEPTPAEPEAVPVEPAEVAEPRAEGKDDDDNSRYISATGGADSRPASTGGTPTEEQPGGVGNGSQNRKLFTVDALEVPDMQELTTKAVAGAKSLGNFLYSAVNKAGAKVSEASAKIKKTVEENSILGEFNREQDAFIKGQEGRGSAAAVPPWVGAPNEPALKEECLSLSTDRRNFVRAPPAGVEFDFDYDKMYPVAVAIMGEDPNLEKMRFDLVPKVITEENFWRNYFYRMSLICQANEADAAAGRQSSADDSQDDDKSASENLIANEKSSQESIDDAKKLIKSLKVDRENEDALSCEGQRHPFLPLSRSSFRTIERGFSMAPGRFPTVSDIIIRHYRTNLTSPSSYRIGNVKSLLTDPEFDVKRPTVIYAHGYVELSTDESITTVVSAYLQRGGYNVLLLDWSNIAFGNYVIIAKTLPGAGQQVGKALLKLVKRGLPVKGLHLVGHSMGSHLAAYAARYLKSRGFTVPRLTGLDPAYPGFYPPLAAPPMSASDATFVDVLHTDGGGYGAPAPTGHADFWPNGGQAKQPGCLSATLLLTNEDFCSHWRSWAFWSESLTEDALLARRCQDYDMFLRGQCVEEPVVFMGIRATPDLRGNFYLRTGAKSPYGLNLRGAS